MATGSELSPNDRLIAVMGPTGAGKSFFVRAATGDQSVKVGHSLQSETSEISGHRLQVGKYSVVLLDTPGFDDTFRSDADVLAQLAQWLAASYSEGARLSGIIYMIPITWARITGSGLRYLKVFRKLIGDDPLGKITYVTTMWGNVDKEVGAMREKEMFRSDGLMGELVSRGSSVCRFDGTPSEARAVVQGLLEKHQLFSVKIQEELIDKKLELQETDAGVEVAAELLQMKANYERDVADLREIMSTTLSKQDALYSERLRKQEAELTRQLHMAQSQTEALAARNPAIEALQRRQDEVIDSLRDRIEFLESRGADPPPPYAVSGVQQGQRLASLPRAGTDRFMLGFPISTLWQIWNSVWMATFAAYSFIRKLFRPKVPDGFRRLQWTCSCGEILYADFREGSPGSLDELATRLAQHSDGSPRATSSQPPNPASSTITTPGKTHIRYPSRPVGWSSAGDGGGGNVPDPLNQPYAPSSGGNPSAVRVRESIELCVESGKYAQVLTETVLEGSISDGEIFRKIRDRYEVTRHSIFPLWMRFKRPEKAIFVKFRLGRRPLVSKMAGSLKAPSIPPKSEVDAKRYSYSPCPIDEPPIDSNTFMHHFYKPAWQHPDILWGPRLPKKLGDSLAHSTQPLDQGWGIELQEAPHWALFSTIMLLFLLFSGAVAGIYSWKTQDSQTGVAIGTWLTTVEALGVTAAFFWWA